MVETNTTRKARVELRDGTVIDATNIDDESWAEFLRLNEWWQSGRAGGIDFHHSDPNRPTPLTFEYADIKQIDLWPGSEEPR